MDGLNHCGRWSISISGSVELKSFHLTPTLTHTKQYPFDAKIPTYILKNLIFNLKCNENDAAFAKKAKIKIKFQKMKGTLFGRHPVIEKSPTVTGMHVCVFFTL